VPLDPSGPQQTSKILLVDDSQTIICVLRAYLVGQGLTLLTAEDAEAALRCVLREQPDLVVTDVQLPGMSGLDLCRVLRVNPRLNHIRLVAISSSWTPERHQEARRIGIDGWLAKPIKAEQLVTMARDLLRQTPRGWSSA
jgi:CheY-like chemotaxis protein